MSVSSSIFLCNLILDVLTGRFRLQPAPMDEADGRQQDHEEQEQEIAFRGHWYHPGKNTQEIALLANKKVRFGVGDQSAAKFCFEHSVLENLMPSIVIGFHHSNVDTKNMRVRQLFFQQCGVYSTKERTIALILVIAIPASFSVLADPHEGLAPNEHRQAKVTLKWFHTGKAVAVTMPVGATYFQAVMDVMNNWSKENMLSKMVNGQYAIEDADHLIRYVTGYCSKRHSFHSHDLVGQVRDAEQWM